ncbi:hypothetical protein [Pseudomonas sp. D2002]|uniref:hypothetical protein n=1 Tax=Pseudomonas sp. D2002 TaxID=2726980 RepID=UPI00210B5A30|nr:hypothetical protein [Pseudomonas sp. D2002]
MAQLVAKRQDGTLLFDTNNITYGLVKSGYMTFIETWRRRQFKGGNVDPNWGGNWTESTVSQSVAFSDVIYGFAVVNAKSPIVFLTGSGCLQGTKIIGNSMVFLYTNASANTKFYCFDLMQDAFVGRGYLKARKPDSSMSFNSLQPPLNIVSAIQAPPPIGTQATQYPIPVGSKPYAGAVFAREQIQTGPNFQVNIYTARVTMSIRPGIEYAAYLPWSRGCQIWVYGSNEPYNTFRYGGSEGCGGIVGGIQFMFGPAGGTPEDHPMVVTGTPMPPSFSQVATDRLPTALAIETSGLPFPFN